jgi:hypothetical protein
VSQNPPGSVAVGQVSPDGQFRWDGAQWVPIPRGVREPTPWTRPMQLAAAGLFALTIVYTLVSTAVFINHDSLLKVMQAQGSLPAGTNIDQVVGVALFFAWAVIIFLCILWGVAAVGSYLGWRWIFWPDLVLLGFGAIGALLNLGNFANPSATEVPVWGIAISELLDVASAAIFAWMIVGLVRYGPWAMKRPGA